YLFTVFGSWNLGHKSLYIVLVISSYPFQAANGNRFFFNPSTAASRLAGAVAGSSQNTRKYVRFPVYHVCFGVLSLSYKPDVFGHGCMCRTGILTIDHFMEVLRVFDVCWFQLLVLI